MNIRAQKPYFSKDFDEGYKKEMTSIFPKLRKLAQTPKDAIPYIRSKLEIAKNNSDYCNLGLLIMNMAQAHSFTQQYDSARIELKLAESYAHKCPKPAYVEYGIYNTYIWIESEKGNDSLALDYANRTLKAAQSLNDTVKIAYTYGNIAGLYITKGDHNSAIDSYFSALEMMKYKKDTIFLCNVFSSLSAAFLGLKNFNKCIEYADECIQLMSNIDSYPKNVAFENKGAALSNLGKYTEAEDVLFKSVRVDSLLDDKLSLSYSYHNLGECYYKQKKLMKAKEFFNKAYELEKKFKLVHEQVNSVRTFAQIAYDEKKYSESLYFINKIIDLAKKHNINDELFYLNNLKIKAILSIENPKLLETFIEYDNMRDSLYQNDLTKTSMELSEKYQTEKKEITNKLLLQKNIANKTKIKNRNILIIIFSLLVLALIAFLTAVIKNFKKEKLVVNLLQEKNDQLLQRNTHLIKDITEARKKENPFDVLQNSFLELDNRTKTKIKLSNIIYLEAKHGKVFIHTTDGQIFNDWQSLKTFADILPKELFIQIQRAFIINIYHMDRKPNGKLQMSNGKELYVSRNYKDNLEESLQKFKIK